MSSNLNVYEPRSPRETLPTMHDLPSEYVGDPGMPDEYHAIQAVLLNETFQPATVSPDEVFSAIDMNLYYDVRHTLWYKSPDWFGVINVPRLYDSAELRKSYVIWQEGISPLIVVEMLSPGTEKEDLGQTLRAVDAAPPKWQVYEQILRVPYYVVFNGETNELRFFKLTGDRYQQSQAETMRFWIPSIELSLGVWQGTYHGVERLWLRWFDQAGNVIPTKAEQATQATQKAEQATQKAEQAEQKAEQAEQKAERLAELLRQLGHDPDQLP